MLLSAGGGTIPPLSITVSIVLVGVPRALSTLSTESRRRPFNSPALSSPNVIIQYSSRQFSNPFITILILLPSIVNIHAISYHTSECVARMSPRATWFGATATYRHGKLRSVARCIPIIPANAALHCGPGPVHLLFADLFPARPAAP